MRELPGLERAFIFRIRLVRCTFTVDSAMQISLAICWRLRSSSLPRSRTYQLIEPQPARSFAAADLVWSKKLERDPWFCSSKGVVRLSKLRMWDNG